MYKMSVEPYFPDNSRELISASHTQVDVVVKVDLTGRAERTFWFTTLHETLLVASQII